MKPLVIYHKNCADGFGAAFAAWLKFGTAFEYWAVQYGLYTDPLQDIDDREVYILDFSFPKQIMDLIFTKAKKVVWLDHHKTAFEMYGMSIEKKADAFECGIDTRHYVELDNSRSGAVIAWEYFFPIEAVPLMFKYIDDYDRWQFKLEETKAFNKAIWSHTPWNFDQWKQILNVDDTETIKLAEEGKAILRAHNQNVMQVVKGSGRPCMIRWIDENGIVHMSKGLSANCPTYLTSDVGHKLAEESGTYGLLWTLNKDGKLLCSLRSTGNYDVSSIAKAFGGGGHLNAAGFEVSILTLLEWIK